MITDQQSKIDDLQARLNELEGQLHVAENGIRHQRAYSADAAACVSIFTACACINTNNT